VTPNRLRLHPANNEESQFIQPYLNSHDFLYFRQFLLKYPLNPHFKSHCGKGAAGTGASQSQADHTVINANQLNITTVSLQSRPYLIQDRFYLLVHGLPPTYFRASRRISPRRLFTSHTSILPFRTAIVK
jgi:hypothetical protein